ncbi:MAG: cell division protein ZapA [Gammaproteobacteria bacterium]|nr:cell division protein ZapA [Gammaproteobacteria bacterium]
MTTSTSVPVTVRILEREYIIACPEDEQMVLHQAVQYLNSKTREMQSKGKAIGADRSLALTALNLANELLQQRSRQEKASEQLHQLKNKIDTALIKCAQMDL